MRIASVDGVTGRLIDATLSIEARGTPIKGAFAIIKHGGDTMLARVVSVTLTNVVHRNETFATYIMQQGSVPNWSAEVDIERAKIEVISVVDGSGNRIPLRRNPSSGTAINPATAEDVALFQNENDRTLIIGHIPNSGDLPASVVNRSFGDFESGGYGEARHIAVFGQNGSGKTVIATVLIVGRLAANPDMGLLMPDTAGDLSNPASHNRGDFKWNYVDALKAANIAIESIKTNDIRLTSQTTLRMKMKTLLKNNLSMTEEKAGELAKRVVAEIITDRKVTVDQLKTDDILAAIQNTIGSVYAKTGRAEHVQDAIDLGTVVSRRRDFERQLERIRLLFDGRHELGHLIRDVLMRGRKVLLKLGDDDADQQQIIMHEVMAELKWRAADAFKERGGRSCNAMVVLDEGQRWIPEGSGSEIGGMICDALRETRKYGLGWMVVSQSPSGVSKDLLRESHTKYFGRGLGIGADRKHLEDTLGKAGVEAYEQLEIQGGYFWVGIGLDCNLGTESTYFSFHPFGGDSTEALIKANPTIFGDL